VSLAVATRKVSEAVGIFLVLVRRHQGEVDHEDSLGSLRLFSSLPLRVPSGLHYTHHHTPGIPFVIVVIAIGVGSRHLENTEHPDNFFNAFDDVWCRIASAE
jgi:hypothetical protein